MYTTIEARENDLDCSQASEEVTQQLDCEEANWSFMWQKLAFYGYQLPFVKRNVIIDNYSQTQLSRFFENAVAAGLFLMLLLLLCVVGQSICAKKNGNEDDDGLFANDQLDEVDIEEQIKKKGKLKIFAEIVYDFFFTSLSSNIASFKSDSLCTFTREKI